MMTDTEKKTQLIDRLLYQQHITPEEAALLREPSKFLFDLTDPGWPSLPIEYGSGTLFPLPLTQILKNDEHNPCDSCSNNPQNGGSGVCGCTLNLPKIRC